MTMPKLEDVCDNAPFHKDIDGGGSTRELYGGRIGSYVATIKREYYDLIAAAPELYECLRYLVEFVGDAAEPLGADCETIEMIAKAHAALAKASGESEVSQ